MEENESDDEIKEIPLVLVKKALDELKTLLVFLNNKVMLNLM